MIASDEPSAAINRDKIVDHVLALDDIPAVLLMHVQELMAPS